MARWKTWHFGLLARSLPVERDTAAWARSQGAKVPAGGAGAVRSPSRAVPETLQAVIGDPARFLVKRRREWDVLKYARLYTGEAYPVPPSLPFMLQDAWLHVPSGFVITRERKVLAFSSHSLPALYEGHAATDLDSAPCVETPAFKLCTAWGNNYAHWLMDGLPKADALASGDARLAVVDKPSPRFQTESLRLLGLENIFAPKTELLRFRELHFVSTGRSGVPDPGPLLRVRNRLREAAGPSAGARRIYISRQQTRRRILNGDEVGRVLGDFGFEEIFTEEMALADQVRLFAGAEAIFGAHGAGTMNVLFAPPGSVLIEAFNPRVWDHAAHRIASLCGVRHYHLFGENASREFDMSLDPRTLERTLALALDRPDHPRPLIIEENY